MSAETTGSENGQPPGFLRELPEGTAVIRLLVMPPHGELKIEAHGLPMMDVHARLMQATAFLDRELTCLRMEERAAARAAAVQLARDVPGRPPFKL